MWSDKIEKLALEPLHGQKEPAVYLWNDSYDRDFIGYMAGVLRCKEFMATGVGVI